MKNQRTWVLAVCLVCCTMVIGHKSVAAATTQDGVTAYEKQDYATALKIYRQRAMEGDPWAQTFLALMYQEGRGIPKDIQQAVTWYRKSAEQGIALAQYNLGWMYSNGEGLPKNDQRAVFWYRKAAEQGDAKAQHNLGLRYVMGEGVPKNEQQAYFWWLLASAAGHEAAAHNRDKVEEMLTHKQRAAAQAQAAKWTPKPSTRQ